MKVSTENEISCYSEPLITRFLRKITLLYSSSSKKLLGVEASKHYFSELCVCIPDVNTFFGKPMIQY